VKWTCANQKTPQKTKILLSFSEDNFDSHQPKKNGQIAEGVSATSKCLHTSHIDMR